MSEKNSGSYAANLALYEAALAVAGLERKGDTVPYTSHNGHMFTYFSKAGVMALRLPEDDLGAFLKRHATRLCIQYGIVQKEYAEVPDELLRKPRELAKYLKTSLAYVSAMKPKPSAKKPGAKKR